MHPRIRTQAYLVGALPLAFLLLLFVLAILIEQGSARGGAIEQATQAILSADYKVEGLITEAGRAATLPGKVPLSRRPAVVRMNREMEPALKQLEVLTAGQPTMQTRVKALAVMSRGGVDVIDRYAALVDTGKTAQARTYATSPGVQRLGQKLTAAQVDFKNSERTLELSGLMSLRDWIVVYERALIVICVLAILITLFFSGRFGIGIARRVRMLAENAERLGNGEPAKPLEGVDEFADLDKVYQAMMMRIAREHHVASTLQRVLLPDRLPRIEGVRIDSVYTPAASEEGVGGDWYDVFALSDRLLCISVGDVAGHGLRAATLMAGARLAMRAAARIDPSPANVLQNVNRVLCADEPDTVVTAFIGLLDLTEGSLRYAVAGHPPPLLISPDGDTSFLEARGFMLGADVRAAYEEHKVPITEGWALVMYTDGVIEAERDYLRGQRDLEVAARAEYFEPSDNIAEAIQRRVMRDTRPRDDAALLFVGVTKLGATARSTKRTWALDAREESSSRRVKRALLWHLGELVEPQSDLSAVELILGELIGNVARHTPGPAEVSIEIDRGHATLQIMDRGKPFQPTNGTADLMAESGRGLFLVRMMANDFRIEHTTTGNTVTAVLPVAMA
ncbi:MAG TPA: SpoIIE family protein phosphatase [Candidatus Baltobacteraceae bacterium]|nr:SpoIIE family protein phosphatase [Candidatus Baltobacteraceae bacterium]